MGKAVDGMSTVIEWFGCTVKHLSQLKGVAVNDAVVGMIQVSAQLA